MSSSNALSVQSAYVETLLGLSSSQRLPSIRATLGGIPPSRLEERLELLCELTIGLHHKSAGRTARELSRIDSLLLEEIRLFLDLHPRDPNSVMKYAEIREYALMPTIIALCCSLPFLPHSSLVRIDLSTLALHILPVIATAFAQKPAQAAIASLPSLTRLLYLSISLITAPSVSRPLLQQLARLAQHLGSRCDSLLTPELSDAAPSLLLLTHASLFLTAVTALLTQPALADHAPRLASTLMLSLYPFSHFIFKNFGHPSAAFPQLRRGFYSALDILSSDPSTAEEFVSKLAEPLDTRVTIRTPSYSHRIAFLLTCAESLLTSLTPSVVNNAILPLCLSCLEDARPRSAFEAAHSFILAMLSLPSSQSAIHVSAKDELAADDSGETVVKFVPFYAACLLENAYVGAFTPDQFSLAYSSLIRACSSFLDPSTRKSTIPSPPALAWYLLCFLVAPLFPADSPDAPHREHIIQTLPSLISTVPTSLLPYLLRYIEAYVLVRHEDGGETVRSNNAMMMRRLREEVANSREEVKPIVLEWWLRVVEDVNEPTTLRARL